MTFDYLQRLPAFNCLCLYLHPTPFSFNHSVPPTAISYLQSFSSTLTQPLVFLPLKRFNVQTCIQACQYEKCFSELHFTINGLCFGHWLLKNYKSSIFCFAFLTTLHKWCLYTCICIWYYPCILKGLFSSLKMPHQQKEFMNWS